MNTGKRHLVITVHGIRTLGQWQDRLGKLLQVSEPEVKTYHYRYGYFSVLAFMIPFLRWLVTRRFRSELEIVLREQEWDRIDIVAHSFGTHLAGWALNSVPQEKRKAIHTILFAGSVLKPNFTWRRLLEGSTARVVNECGIRDTVLVCNQLFVLFSGMAGRVGFTGMTSERLINRYYDMGHSGYFLRAGSFSDHFMQQNWIPLLTSNAPPVKYDERPIPSFLEGVVIWALNHTEPIKLSIYSVLVAIPTLVFFLLYIKADYQKDIATARLLVSHARPLINQKPDLALLLSAEANKRVLQRSAQTLWSKFLGVAFVPPLENQDIKGVLRDALQFHPFLEKLLHSHHGSITNVASIPDSEKLASISVDGKLLLWDLRNANYTNPLSYPGQLFSLAYSSDGRLVAIGGEGDEITIWDTNKGKIFEKFRMPGSDYRPAVLDLKFSADTRYLFALGISGQVYAWQMEPPHSWRKLPVKAFRIEVSPDGNYLAAATMDGIKLLSLKEQNTEPLHIPDKKYVTRALVFSHDSRFLFWANEDNSIRMWNVSERKIWASLTGHVARITSLAITNDDYLLAAGADDGNVRLWALAQFVKKLEPAIITPRPVAALAFSADGKTLAVGSGSHDVYLFDTTRRNPIARPLGSLPIYDARASVTKNGSILALAGSTSGKRDSFVVQLWDLPGTRLIKESPLNMPEITSSRSQVPIELMQIAEDQKTITVVGDNGVSVLDSMSLGLIEMPFNTKDLGNRYRKRFVEGEKGFGVSMALSFDGKTLAVTDSDVDLWDVTSKQIIDSFNLGDYSGRTAFDHNGIRMATSIGNHIDIRGLHNRQKTIGIDAVGNVQSIRFSPDSNTIGAVLNDKLVNRIALWELASAPPKLLWETFDERGEVGRDIVFSGTGLQLASAARNTIRIWDTKTGRVVDDLLLHLEEAEAYVSQLLFSGDELIAVHSTGALIITLDVRSWIKKACEIANRQLTLQEWNYFIGETVPYENTCP